MRRLSDGGSNCDQGAQVCVYHFTLVLASATEILRKSIPQRYRLAVSIQLIALWQRRSILESCKTKTMADDKLKSTTVRFTDSDLLVINHLREKLGLGMIQVIRLAIRRLAEIENVLPPSPARRKD
jgi:hypothetical protein